MAKVHHNIAAVWDRQILQAIRLFLHRGLGVAGCAHMWLLIFYGLWWCSTLVVEVLMKAKDLLGRRGELLAADFLEDRGIKVIDRNWRCPTGEI
ncbi:YraN family protein, partial [Paenarthrobacter sp. Z7-10]|uniref:YraN family protein n=1 Tax=Paenarthrobacter sp. Z7-10 TaxID=2787635 RepID=UPI0022A9EF3E